MKKLVISLAFGVLALSLMISPARAQFYGNPTYAVVYGTGFTILGDYGRGLNDESGKTNYFGGRAALGLPILSLWAGGGVYKPEGDGAESQATFGGGATLNLLKGPMVPVTVGVQAGAAVESESGYGTTINVPAGVVVAINVPSPTVDVKPWIMPRVELERFSPDGVGESSSDVGFGVSGGLDVTLPTGFGFHLAGDWRSIKFGEGTAEYTWKPFLLGAGIHYKVAIPSLGM